MVNKIEFLTFKEDIQKKVENMASKKNFQEVKAMLKEIIHSFLPHSSPQEDDNEENKDLFQSQIDKV